MEGEEITTVGLGYVTLAPGTIASDYALKSLNESLGKAQAEFTPSIKGEVNQFGGYKYTPLVAIIAAVRPALTKNHLTVSQFPAVDLDRKTVTIYTRIVHWDSGEWMQNELELPAELALGKGGMPVFNQQTIGGSETYGMKYAYKPIVGIPDSEEMIDSTEEKGDLPARPKGQAKQQAKQTVDEFVAQKSTPAFNDRQKQQPPVHDHQGKFELVPPNGVICTLTNVRELQSRSGKPIVMVKFNGDLNLNQAELTNGATCFDTGLFDSLKAGLNKEVQFTYKVDKEQKYISITDVFFVAGVEYVNGKPSIEEAQQ